MRQTMAVLLATVLGLGPAAAQGPKEAQGQMVGGFLGGILGSVIPGGGSVGADIARQMAPTVGSAIGGSIGAQLDAEDRLALERATRRAMASGSGQSFTGQSGVRGTAIVTSSSKNAEGQACRTVKQEVVLPDGTMLGDTVSGCKGPNGWQI